MATDTFATSEIFTQYILPFLLIFVIVFGVLERSKLFGEDKKQLNAILAFVMGFIFIGFLVPKAITTNLVLFVSVALVVMLVFLLLYGFVASDMEKGLQFDNYFKYTALGVIVIAVVLAFLWASGIGAGSDLYYLAFNQPWSQTFWTNFLFIVVIGAALGIVLKSSKSS